MTTPELQQLGDYTLLKLLGQGSLGTVYLAEHRFMKRQYALKVLPESLSADRNFLQRFQVEVGALSALDHPHIARIHSVSSAQGKYFLVMDCVVDAVGETTNLSQFLATQGDALAEQDVVRILKQVAQALDYAHSKGAIHGGVKLNNILVSGSGGEFSVKLTDFGLAHIVGTAAVLTRTLEVVAEAYSIASHLHLYPSPSVEARLLTPLHGSFLQNWAFLAPEKKRLGSEGLDSKIDAYSFGVLAYYLTTGQYPEGNYTRPSQQTPNYRFQWDALVDRCLSQDPSLRPETLQVIVQTTIAAAPPVQIRSPQPVQPPALSQPPTEVLLPKINVEPVLTGAVSTNISGSATSLRPVIKKKEVQRPVYDPDPLASLAVDSTVVQYQPIEPKTSNVEPIPTDMVVIEGGEFLRGAMGGNRDEMPAHRICLASFAIDIHPVTNDQFIRFLEVMKGEKDSVNHDMIRLRESRIKRRGGQLTIESGYNRHPVVGITWYGAAAYAQWMGKRLPTEGEWEVAATGGIEGMTYPTGQDIEKKEANFFSSDSTPVLSYSPNGYGLYDMAGNVYEWCHDWYGYNYYEVSAQEPDLPKGPLQGVYRVLRGGCWKSLKEDLRCSHRHRNNPGTFNGTYGFRCATPVEGE
jgi:formylglycine-generating enzyme required for sulfatase activity/tRNA A-37 threonylcarbamoyl transferase component Bud32